MLATGPTKLVLAFDIGTTYSSIAYSILEPHATPEVRAVARFPAQGIARSDTKVPSLLYYDKRGAVKAVGAEALTPEAIQTARIEGWAKAEWWKLHLYSNHSSIYIDDIPPLPPGKSATDILTDFIKYLFDCSKAYIQECHPGLAWSSLERSIEYILTYPSSWDGQQHLYRHAIARAGLVPSVLATRSRVHTLTAGQGSLYFCVRKFLNWESAKPFAEGVAVIDAGGGVIDLSLFSVTMPSSKITCEEISPPECRLQGPVFVTGRAATLMEKKLQGWEHSTAEDIARFASEFDQTTKLVIESDQEPAYVRVAGRRVHSSRHCISSGQLKLSGEEATGLFGDTVDAIIGAFEQQEKLASVAIRTIFLVGGLSANDWLWFRLQSYFMAKNIRIHRLDNHAKKVVAEGALLSRIYANNHLGGAFATHNLRDGDKERDRKTTLRDRLSQCFRKVLGLARRCRWLGRTLSDFSAQTGWLAYQRGSLSGSQWVDQNQRAPTTGSRIPTRCPGGTYPSKKLKTSDGKPGSEHILEAEWRGNDADGQPHKLEI